MKNSNKSWIDIFLLIIKFILGKRKKDKEVNKEVEDRLSSEYDKLDKEKESRKDENLSNRLNNMF